MADVTVKASGGDYTTLNAALAGEEGDWVTAAEVLTITHFRNDDTTAVAVGSGWTTSDTYHVAVAADATVKHAGQYDSNKARVAVARTALTIANPIYLRVRDMQITSSDSYVYTISATGLAGGTAAHVLFLRCLVLNLDTSSNASGALATFGYTTNTSTDHKLLIDACVIAMASSYGNCIMGNHGGMPRQQLFVYSSTICNGFRSFFRVAGRFGYVRNCILYNPASDLDDRDFTSNQSYISTDLETTRLDAITGGRTEQTFTFTDAANHDYHLGAADAGAKDYGVDLSSNPDSCWIAPSTADIDGVTRSGTWDIGADEYVSAVTGNPWNYYAQL